MERRVNGEDPPFIANRGLLIRLHAIGKAYGCFPHEALSDQEFTPLEAFTITNEAFAAGVESEADARDKASGNDGRARAFAAMRGR